jgi:hypothetical protein
MRAFARNDQSLLLDLPDASLSKQLYTGRSRARTRDARVLTGLPPDRGHPSSPFLEPRHCGAIQ